MSRPFLLPLTGLFVHDNPPPPSLLIIIILIPIIIYIDTRGRGRLHPASRTSSRSRTAGRLDGLRSLVDQRVEVLSGAVDAVRASGQDQTSAQRALDEELTRAQVGRQVRR